MPTEAYRQMISKELLWAGMVQECFVQDVGSELECEEWITFRQTGELMRINIRCFHGVRGW